MMPQIPLKFTLLFVLAVKCPVYSHLLEIIASFSSNMLIIVFFLALRNQLLLKFCTPFFCSIFNEAMEAVNINIIA